jgi:hypothetical protein
MGEEKLLTKEIVEQLFADEESINLSVFTKTEDDAAEILSKHEGDDLLLNGLTQLSDAAAEGGECVLTRAIAEKLIEDRNFSVYHFTQMEDDAAELLSSFDEYREDLSFCGLTELSDAAAESLSRCEGNLSLDGLTELSDAAAESLSKCKGLVSLNGLTELSDAAAESLSKCKGDLYLNGLTQLSDAVAESLSKHKGGIELDVETDEKNEQ